MAEPQLVEGLTELLRALEALPDRVERKVLRAATMKGAGVIRKAVIRRAPVDAGDLRKNILRKARRFAGGVSVDIGPARRVFYAMFIEFGTAAHTILAPMGGVLRIAGIVIGFRAEHPGTQAKPFMRPALMESIDPATDAVAAGLEAGIAREVRKLR